MVQDARPHSAQQAIYKAHTVPGLPKPELNPFASPWTPAEASCGPPPQPPMPVNDRNAVPFTANQAASELCIADILRFILRKTEEEPHQQTSGRQIKQWLEQAVAVLDRNNALTSTDQLVATQNTTAVGASVDKLLPLAGQPRLQQHTVAAECGANTGETLMSDKQPSSTPSCWYVPNLGILEPYLGEKIAETARKSFFSSGSMSTTASLSGSFERTPPKKEVTVGNRCVAKSTAERERDSLSTILSPAPDCPRLDPAFKGEIMGTGAGDTERLKSFGAVQQSLLNAEYVLNPTDLFCSSSGGSQAMLESRQEVKDGEMRLRAAEHRNLAPEKTESVSGNRVDVQQKASCGDEDAPRSLGCLAQSAAPLDASFVAIPNSLNLPCGAASGLPAPKYPTTEKSMWPSLQRGISKTKICIHHLRGRCSRADHCSFAHSITELRKPPNLLKTRLCINFMANGLCSKGVNCRFAHGHNELRTPTELEAANIEENDVGGMQISEQAQEQNSYNTIQKDSFFDARYFQTYEPSTQQTATHNDNNILHQLADNATYLATKLQCSSQPLVSWLSRKPTTSEVEKLFTQVVSDISDCNLASCIDTVAKCAASAAVQAGEGVTTNSDNRTEAVYRSHLNPNNWITDNSCYDHRKWKTPEASCSLDSGGVGLMEERTTSRLTAGDSRMITPTLQVASNLARCAMSPSTVPWYAAEQPKQQNSNSDRGKNNLCSKKFAVERPAEPFTEVSTDTGSERSSRGSTSSSSVGVKKHLGSQHIQTKCTDKPGLWADRIVASDPAIAPVAPCKFSFLNNLALPFFDTVSAPTVTAAEDDAKGINEYNMPFHTISAPTAAVSRDDADKIVEYIMSVLSD